MLRYKNALKCIFKNNCFRLLCCWSSSWHFPSAIKWKDMQRIEVGLQVQAPSGSLEMWVRHATRFVKKRIDFVTGRLNLLWITKKYFKEHYSEPDIMAADDSDKQATLGPHVGTLPMEHVFYNIQATCLSATESH